MAGKNTLESIREAMKNPLPTAPVGTPVQWFELNEEDRCYSALVTKVEGPGKVQLVIHKPNAMPTHKSGVLHRTHPVHQNKHATETMRNGAWDYLPGEPIPKSHREVHLNELRRRETGILELQKQAAEAALRAEAAANATTM